MLWCSLKRQAAAALLLSSLCQSLKFVFSSAQVCANEYFNVVESAMDYSSLPNDPDHPAGTDPWQSSPQPSRTTFNPPESGDVPSSPLAKHTPSTPGTQNPDGLEESDQEPPTNSMSDDIVPQQNGIGKVPAALDSSNSPQIQSNIRFQDQPLTEEELRQKQLYEQRQQERYQQMLHAQQHQRGPPGRYHQQAARQGQRPPQYRLQAKVTGLERTGKKDPAIRFDIHVRSRQIEGTSLKLTSYEDQSSQVPDYASQRHQAHAY